MRAHLDPAARARVQRRVRLGVQQVPRVAQRLARPPVVYDGAARVAALVAAHHLAPPRHEDEGAADPVAREVHGRVELDEAAEGRAHPRERVEADQVVLEVGALGQNVAEARDLEATDEGGLVNGLWSRVNGLGTLRQRMREFGQRIRE